jgi:acetyl-CoA C-acetyltransferase
MLHAKPVYIISAVRTPIGSFSGILSSFSAVQLGTIALRGALEKAGIAASDVQEVIMGNVVSSNLGQAPARQAALAAGIPDSVPCTTINKVCASGTKAAMWGAQSIMLGQADIVAVGGMESMSNIPYYIPKARFGYKYGNGELVDGLDKDGLQDVYQRKAMGVFADATAAHFGISREQQDQFAIQSYKKSASSTESGHFKNEIIPVSIPQKKGEPLLISEDEEYKNVLFDKIPSLRPAFTPDGTVTAANASTINDGAAALILASEEAVKRHNLKPIARILAFSDGEQAPEWFTTAPTLSVPRAVKLAGLSLDDIDYFEINEAFSVVPLAFEKILQVPDEKMNAAGGAVSLGHPLGASGARIITTLCHVLNSKGARYGAVGICNGGGGSSAMVIERM